MFSKGIKALLISIIFTSDLFTLTRRFDEKLFNQLFQASLVKVYWTFLIKKISVLICNQESVSSNLHQFKKYWAQPETIFLLSYLFLLYLFAQEIGCKKYIIYWFLLPYSKNTIYWFMKWCKIEWNIQSQRP